MSKFRINVERQSTKKFDSTATKYSNTPSKETARECDEREGFFYNSLYTSAVLVNLYSPSINEILGSKTNKNW